MSSGEEKPDDLLDPNVEGASSPAAHLSPQASDAGRSDAGRSDAGRSGGSPAGSRASSAGSARSSKSKISSVITSVTLKALKDFGDNQQPRQQQQPVAEEEEEEQQQPQDRMPQRRPEDVANLSDIASLVPAGGGDGGGGDDDDDDDDDDSQGGGGDGAQGFSDDDDDDSGDEDMVVLDPDHPLMRRFQNVLTTQLEKQNEKITFELKDLLETLKARKVDREDLGVQLYGVQQELARNQMAVETVHDEFAENKQEREQEDEVLQAIQDQYKEAQGLFASENHRVEQLQSQVENLALRLYYMSNTKTDVQSDIAVMRRAAEKAEREVAKMEMGKQKQDVFVDRIVERVDKLKEDIAMYEAQTEAQRRETSSARENLGEALMEIDAIGMEKKTLFEQWNASIVGMRRRDEAHAAIDGALTTERANKKSLETEIEGYKKTILKEQENNERLTITSNKADNEIATFKKLLSTNVSKVDQVKAEYSTYTRMLTETEAALRKASADKLAKYTEVVSFRKQIQDAYAEKQQLEDSIIFSLRHGLAMDKAAEHVELEARNIRDRTRNLEQEAAKVENGMSKVDMDMTAVKVSLKNLSSNLATMEVELAEKNNMATAVESEINRKNAAIQRKQTNIDQLNKKLEAVIALVGGVEIGPLEIQVNTLQKSIDAKGEEIQKTQQRWLRLQTELVRMTEEKEKIAKEVQHLSKKLVILQQKKIRTESKIENESRDIEAINRTVRDHQNDMLKLNQLIYRETQTEEQMDKSNILMEGDFVGELKEAELKSIQMSSNLDDLKSEKEGLLGELVEAEKQIMLWEKKIQLTKETKAAVASEHGQGEIDAMKAEIHRMQVRYNQLIRTQETMIQEMERAVARRDAITVHGEAQQKLNKNLLTKGAFEREAMELKKKIKGTIGDAFKCDEEIGDLRHHQEDLANQLEDKQRMLEELSAMSNGLEEENEQYMEHKAIGLQSLLSYQQRSKWYDQVKKNKYTMVCRTENALENELLKQQNRVHTLEGICDRLVQDHPQMQIPLRRVTQSIRAKTLDLDDGGIEPLERV